MRVCLLAEGFHVLMQELLTSSYFYLLGSTTSLNGISHYGLADYATWSTAVSHSRLQDMKPIIYLTRPALEVLYKATIYSG